MRHFSYMHILAVAVMAALLAACASIGRPQGGPRDETPPVFVRANPAPGTVNFKGQRIDAFFDENIKVEDAASKVVISPAQQQMPQIIGNGHRLTVTLKDTLIPNTTYTIDFADAVRDLNEGNILDGFALDFATGPTIDSLRISGIVLQARNLEPAQGIYVGAYTNLCDTAISTIKLERIAKTNQYGQFTLRNLKDTVYRIFALNDLNRDFHWDRSEDVAFYDFTVRPWSEPIEVTDTLVDQFGNDSLATRPGTRFLPNDILLTWFNEDYKAQYLKNYTRPDRHKIFIKMAAPADSLPVLTIVNGPNEGREIGPNSRLNYTQTLDSLEYWIADSAIIKQDSLIIATRYRRTDSLDQLTWVTDTLRYIYKAPKENKKKDSKKKKNDEPKDSTANDSTPPPPPITFLKITGGSNTQEVNLPLNISMSQPVQSIDSAGVHLEIQEDTLWRQLPDVALIPDSTGQILNYTLSRPWLYGSKYRLTVDSAAVMGIYNQWNDKFTQEFTVKNMDDYSTLTFTISSTPLPPPIPFSQPAPVDSLATDSTSLALHADSLSLANSLSVADSLSVTLADSVTAEITLPHPATPLVIDSLHPLPPDNPIAPDSILSLAPDSLSVSIDSEVADSMRIAIPADSVSAAPVDTSLHIIVELLSNSDAVVRTAPVVNGKALFEFIAPGTYYARAFIDRNGNSKWDTGDLLNWVQPEEVYYYPKKINIKQNWDMEQSWDIYELPVDTQKPLEIKKNKPKTKDKKNSEDDYDEDDEDYYDDSDPFGSSRFSTVGNGSQYNNAGGMGGGRNGAATRRNF